MIVNRQDAYRWSPYSVASMASRGPYTSLLAVTAAQLASRLRQQSAYCLSKIETDGLQLELKKEQRE